MGLSAEQLRDHVRVFLDTDEEELTDALLDVFRDEAIDLIEQGSRHWTFYETAGTFTTVEQQQTYVLTDIDASLRELQAVQGSTYRLQPLGHEDAQRRYAWSSAGSSRPCHWSIWGDTLYLWPVPSSAVDLDWRGYRTPDPIDSGEPDMPDAFHRLIATWMLARAYQQQDDDVMAQQHFQTFERQFDVLRRRYETANDAGVSVLGGKPYSAWNRFPYDWE